MTVRLSFAGGAGSVTGSKYLVELPDQRRLLLDCGLFQGMKSLRLRNWAPLPFDPSLVSTVLLSHAHLDHSGALPLLVRQGFRGQILATAGTVDLARVLLADAAHLQEEDAARANRRGYTRHHPALPLFTQEDAAAALARMEACRFDEVSFLGSGVQAIFRRAGHILGSSTVELSIARSPGSDPLRVVFSGDLGRWGRPILRDPAPVPQADVLLIESTYGDRQHPTDSLDNLVAVIQQAEHRGGVVVVPSFAVGRTQELLWNLRELEAAGRIPTLPVFVDSPMATAVTEIYGKHPEDHDEFMAAALASGRDPFATSKFRMIRSVEESKALNDRKGAFIVIAGSGMATGGRVLHHLRQHLANADTTVLLPGFQAAGTRGRSLREGAPFVKIHGQMVPVRARIVPLDGMSAHGDQSDLLRWLGGFRKPPKITYVVHGENDAALGLKRAIETRLGWRVAVAQDATTVELP